MPAPFLWRWYLLSGSSWSESQFPFDKISVTWTPSRRTIMDDAASPPARQPQNQNFRSAASNNWRVKDDAPRVEHQPPRARYNRSQNDPRQHSQSQSHSSISAQQANDEAAGTRLYVGNLLYTAQRTDIEELFTSHGFNVVGVSISTDPFTGRNPSYCFVDVDSADEAQRAIAELNGTDVLGRAVRVSPGVAKRGPSGANGGNANASASPGAAGGAGGGREVRVKNFERGWGRETREERSKFVHHHCFPVLPSAIPGTISVLTSLLRHRLQTDIRSLEPHRRTLALDCPTIRRTASVHRQPAPHRTTVGVGRRNPSPLQRPSLRPGNHAHGGVEANLAPTSSTIRARESLLLLRRFRARRGRGCRDRAVGWEGGFLGWSAQGESSQGQ